VPNTKKRRHQMAVDPADQFGDFPHGGNVRGNVEGVRDEQ
jgi:hypothetical protein